jgi:hypothetical protein
MRTVPESVVFTRAEARSCGWTDAAIGRAIRSGRLTRVRHGYLTVGGAPSLVLAATAAARACPSGVVSHRSAAALRRIPVLGARPAWPELTVPPDGIGALSGVHLYRATLRPVDVELLDGTPVTAAARTAVDLARHLRFAAGVAALDDVLHRRLATLDEIHDVLRACWNWPGIRRAHRVVAAADGRAESPLESVSRLVIARLRLPRPEPQRVITSLDGLILGRGDFYWDEFGVVGEADGRSKYDDRDVLWDEKRRQEDFECTGLVVTRWGWDDATIRPRLLRARLIDAFERGRLRDRSGFPRRWSVRAA